MEENWYQSIYFRPKNNLLPELVYKDGSRAHLLSIGKTKTLMDLIKESFLFKDDRPIIIFNGTHFIDHLDKLCVSPKHLEILQTKDIAFYFFEPLTHYIPKPGRDPMLESHILRIDNSLDDLEKDIRCFELESISKWAEENTIENIYVYCTDHLSWDYYQSKYPKLKLMYMDLFVIWWSSRFSLMERRRWSGHPFHDIYVERITKKFWSGAWRYDPSRHFITAYLAGKDLIENNNVSFYFKVSNAEMVRRMWFRWKEFESKHPTIASTLLEGNTKLQELVPLSIEIDNPVVLSENGMDPEADAPGFNVRQSHDPIDSYYESFCAIVQETRVTQPWPNISEKTLNAIKSYRPFLLVAAPGTLKMLKEMGFKTFDAYWPEDYDDIISNKDRLARICEIIDYIDTFNIDELKNMFEDMTSILTHNYETLQKLPEYYQNINCKLYEKFSLNNLSAQ